jgi:hypothetical protein
VAVAADGQGAWPEIVLRSRIPVTAMWGEAEITEEANRAGAASTKEQPRDQCFD